MLVRRLAAKEGRGRGVDGWPRAPKVCVLTTATIIIASSSSSSSSIESIITPFIITSICITKVCFLKDMKWVSPPPVQGLLGQIQISIEFR